LVLRQGEQVHPARSLPVEEAIPKALAPAEGIGIQDIKFFLPVPVKVGGSHPNCHAPCIGQGVVCLIHQGLPIPLQDSIGATEPAHKQLKGPIPIQIASGNPVEKGRWVKADLRAAILEHGDPIGEQ
jgi:hypothetical protein